MPPKIRAMLTLAVILFTTLIWYIRDSIMLTASPYLVFGLTAFMCAAVWMFPEVKKEERRSR